MTVACVIVQTLWVGQSMTVLEELSLLSFLRQGHEVHLYSYEPSVRVPRGVKILDANEILPKECVFSYGPRAGRGQGSLAGFANLFRYKLLYDRGGWWFDTDVVCLQPFRFSTDFVFAAQDEYEINNAVLRSPKGSQLMSLLYDRARAMGSDLKWGDTGPKLLTECVKQQQLERYALSAESFYPVPYSKAADLLRADEDGEVLDLLTGSFAVHFWNEILRRNNIDKNSVFAPSSVIERLKKRYMT